MTLITTPTPARRRPLYRDLSFQVLAGMALGIAVGHYLPNVGAQLQPLGDAFIRLIQMVVGPIIFCSVVLGIAGVGDMKKVGRVAITALIYFEVVTSIALVIGLVTINLFKPGAGMNVDVATLNTTQAASYISTAREFVSTSQFLLHIIPRTIVSGFAEGDILQILFVSVLFGFGLAAARERAQPMLKVVDSFASGLFWIIGLAMTISPIAAFGAIAFTVSRFGVGSLVSLGKLMGEFYFTCAVFLFLVLWPIARLSGFSLFKLIRYIRSELLLVLGTSSSESVFPQLLSKLEQLGVERSVVGLVLAATLAATNAIPVASIALVLGVHRLLSGVFINIIGNAVATIVVAGREHAVDRATMRVELDRGYLPPAIGISPGLS